MLGTKLFLGGAGGAAIGYFMPSNLFPVALLLAFAWGIASSEIVNRVMK